MKTIAFFNNKGGVGKTTLVYHVAWMLAELGETVLAVDLDPQSNLTSMFLEEDALLRLWPDDGEHPDTIFGAVRPISRGVGDVKTPHVERITDRIGLVVGDLALSTFEDKLSEAWPKCHNRDEAAFRTMSAFHRAAQQAANVIGAAWVLIDVGPNLGAINRSALIASEFVVTPLSPDLFSLQGLRNLGPTLRSWRTIWAELRTKSPDHTLDLPSGRIETLGYVVMQHGSRENKPSKSYKRWIDLFPSTYREVLLEGSVLPVTTSDRDPYCLGMLKHYRSLVPMAMYAGKPVFDLKPADGAIGAHGEAVRRAYSDFEALTRNIAERCGASLR